LAWAGQVENVWSAWSRAKDWMRHHCCSNPPWSPDNQAS